LPLSPDRALQDPEDDRLGYAPFAKQLARSLLRGCPADGLVVALYGAWGTGKSTALNFILHYLEADPDAEAPIVVRFNPWWFAGHEDLVRRFFRQFEAALFKAKTRKRSLLKKLSAFSSVVSELPIPYAGTAAKATKAVLAAIDKADVVELKAELVAELAKDASRIVVVIDDIDRLAADEIRQLFQVVKAVADFPNVIYLLAFDRDVVVKALESAGGAQGDEYLEKIVQVPFTLPPPDRTQLQTMLFERLNGVLANTPEDLFDQQHWGNVYLDGIDPFIRKPRDVIRLVNAISVTYPAVLGEVNAVDFIAIEALRVFSPSAYETVRSNPDLFVGGGDRAVRGDREAERRFHDAWLGQLADERNTVQKLVGRLFPRLASVWGNTTYGDSYVVEWRKRRRACSPEVFPIYFRLAVPEGEVSAATVREALAETGDADAFGKRILALSSQRRPDGHTRATSLLMRLNDHAEKDIPEGHIPSVVQALFDVGDDVVRTGKRTTSPLDLGDEYRIGWLVHALLKRLPKDSRAAVLTEAFKRGRGLVTIVRELVYMGGQHGKWNRNAVAEDERLVPLANLEALEREVLGRVMAAASDGSIWSSFLPSVLLDTWGMLGNREEMKKAVAERVRTDEALILFMRMFVTHMHSHGFTDRVGRTTVQYDPQRLADFLDVDEIAKRVEELLAGTKLQPDDRVMLEAFVRGRKARAQGKDPRWMDPDLET
jgi:predicted KAP-like P-loop ATPase